MVTLKLPVTYMSKEDKDLMLLYIRQGTYLFRAMFNSLNKGMKVDFNTFNHYKNIELLDTWMRQSIYYDAKAIVDTDNLNKSVCFGGRHNFNLKKYDRIDKETYKSNRLHPLCVIGEKLSGTKRVWGNRRFKILDDLSGVTYRPKKSKEVITMSFSKNIKKNYKEALIKMYEHQCVGDLPLTFRISADDFLSITCDETVIYSVQEHPYIDDLVFSIDMNPNYIGWSVVK